MMRALLTRPRAATLVRSRLERSLRHASDASIAPLELHYTPTPNGWKITLLLEEAGLPPGRLVDSTAKESADLPAHEAVADQSDMRDKLPDELFRAEAALHGDVAIKR